jgi:hypothetical protein
MKKLKILSASEARRIDRNTIWVLTCLDKKNREQFLGAYPSQAEGEQAGLEEFGHRRETLVVGYDPALLLIRGAHLKYNLLMTGTTETCKECENLKKASYDAYRSWRHYRPMHTGNRPQSRWFKDDRNAVSQLQQSYNLAEAKYQLHLATHKDDSNPRDVARNISTVFRKGRLEP